MRAKPWLLIIAFFTMIVGGIFAQDDTIPSGDSPDAGSDPGASLAGLTGENPFNFTFSLGTDTLQVPGAEDGVTDNYQRFGFSPELTLGQFGIGLDILLRAKIALGQDDPFQIYLPDWIPNYMGNGTTIWDIYLPKFLYIRYGQRNSPLYVKLGSIEDLTLGNGFIMGSYSNMSFMPQTRIFGLGAGIDGELFKFPYIGAEFAVGNLARMDVFGGRFFVRPLAWLKLPVIPDFELGGELVIDREPYLYSGLEPVAGAQTLLWGIDARLPIIPGNIFPMTAYADYSLQPGGRSGAMAGLSGKLFAFLPYSVQVRILNNGFMPSYFDSSYDTYRAQRYEALLLPGDGSTIAGWYAKTGYNFKEKVVFSAQVDGPFAGNPTVASDNPAEYPHLRAVLFTQEGLIGGFSLSGSYDKFFLGRSTDFWSDLISANDAQINATLSYKSGIALISLLYNLRYDPATESFDITSSLQTSLSY